MKLPSDNQVQLVRLMSRLRHPAWLIVALAMLLVPGAFGKLGACCFAITTLALQRDGKRLQQGWIVALFFIVTTTFILTPVATYMGADSQGAMVILLLIGCLIWLVCATRLNLPNWAPTASPTLLPVFMFFWLVILRFLVLPGYDAAPVYRGDEVYHIMSAQLYRLHLQELLLRAWPGLAWGVWLIVVIALIIKKPRQKWWLWGALISGLILAVISAHTAYSTAMLQHDLAVSRAMRYPPALAWLSALLAGFTVNEISLAAYTETNIYRLLSALSLMLIGLGFARSPRWRHNPLPALVAGVVMLTVPNIHYHSAILYLDLPVLTITVLVLLDARHILTAPADQLASRHSWWCLLLLGMLKESAAPILAIIIASRWFVQLSYRHHKRRMIRDELITNAATLGPLLIYLVIRSKIGARPYGGEFANLLDLSLWLEAMSAIWQQSGLILLAAIVGFICLIRQCKTAEALLMLLLFVGLKAFFLADTAEYNSLARFNLYVLPPVIVLAWHAYLYLHSKKRVIAYLAAGIIIATNLAMSPVAFDGTRTSDWGDTNERWYPFDTVMLDLFVDNPDAQIALGNADSDYGLNILASQLGWPINPIRYSPFHDDDTRANIIETFQAAQAMGIDTMIYRFEGEPDVELPSGIGIWRLWKTYTGTGGTLAVYVR